MKYQIYAVVNLFVTVRLVGVPLGPQQNANTSSGSCRIFQRVYWFGKYIILVFKLNLKQIFFVT